MKLNNWSNVVRWEMRPRVFLRTTEFLWQEGHTCHANEAEARAHAWEVLDDVYGAFMTGVLAIPVIKGRKTARERFAGAINTLTCEAMMGDGKALQMGTSHELGQNFARAFDVQYLAASGQREYVWQTSWGVSTRMVGGLIMCHGDDAGLRVPPRLAPVQALVLVVKDDAEVRARAHQTVGELRDAGVRALLDEQTDISFGRRAIDAELKGIPVRVELGPRDVVAGKAVLARRIPGAKEPVALTALVSEIETALSTDQQTLYDQALARREAASPHVESADEALEAAARLGSYPFHETCQDGSWSRSLAGATLTQGLSLPVAVPVAAGGGLTWVSSGLVFRPAATRLGRLGRERGQVARGVEVPVEPGTAVLADELPLGEGELGSHRTTRRAGLGRRVPPVGDDQAHTGVRCLVVELAAQLRHPQPGDRAGEAAVADHPGHVQVLDDDRVVGCHEAGGQLVQPVATGIGHAGVQRADASLRLAPPVRWHGAGAPVRATPPRRLPPGAAQRSQGAVEVARVGHDLPGGQHREGFDPEVHADDPAIGTRCGFVIGQLHGERDVPAAPLVGQGRRADARGPSFHLAGELAGGLVGADVTDAGELDVAAVRAETEGSGGEPAAQTPAAALEPGEPHPATGAGIGARGRPVAQGGGEVGQPARVRLLAVLRPPRRPDILHLVPRATQAERRPRHRWGELVLAYVVAALGGPLIEVGADQFEPEVVGEPLRAEMRPERLGLGVGRVQREQESPDHPTHTRSDHRQNPPTAPPPRHYANRRQPGSPPRAGRAERHDTEQRPTFRRTARGLSGSAGYGRSLRRCSPRCSPRTRPARSGWQLAVGQRHAVHRAHPAPDSTLQPAAHQFLDHLGYQSDTAAGSGFLYPSRVAVARLSRRK